MGRKKLPILTIDDPKQRTITFNKRKSGFLKKAAELAKLCNIKMFVAFTDVFENLVLYYNEDMEFLDLDKYRERSKKIYSFTNNDYPHFFKTKKQQKNDLSFSFNPQILRNHQRPIQIIKSISKPIVENPKQDNLSPNKLVIKSENNTITNEPNGIALNKTKRSLSIKIPENNKELENRMKCIKIIHDVNGPNEINERKIFNEGPKINNEGNIEQNDLQKLLYSYNLRNQLYSGDYLSLKQPISLLFSNNSKEKKDYRLFPGEDHIFVKKKKKIIKKLKNNEEILNSKNPFLENENNQNNDYFLKNMNSSGSMIGAWIINEAKKHNEAVSRGQVPNKIQFFEQKNNDGKEKNEKETEKETILKSSKKIKKK